MGRKKLDCFEMQMVPESVQYLKTGEGLFRRACSDRLKGNDWKLEQGRLDIRRKFCTMEVVKRLPRDVPGDVEDQSANWLMSEDQHLLECIIPSCCFLAVS